MSGAQGAQPPGAQTATRYESVVEEGGQQHKPRLDLRSREDEGGVPVQKLEDKVASPTGQGGPVFGAGKDEEEDKKQDLGVTGTA